jgi:hypothetical protein
LLWVLCWIINHSTLRRTAECIRLAWLLA